MDSLQEKEEEIVITQNDIDNMDIFFKHFNIPMSDKLVTQIAFWQANKDNFTQEMAKEFKVAVSHAFLSADHKLLQNEVWQGVLKNCNETYYNSQFDKDLEAVLTTED